MADSFYPFDGVTVTETQFSQFFRELAETGVAGDAGLTDLKVTPNANMLLNIAAGFAIVRGHAFKRDAPGTIAIATANTTPRIDAVVLRLDPTANSIVPAVITGTPGGSFPTLNATDSGLFDFLLAYVTVAANTTSIAASAIDDRRRFTGRGTGHWTTNNRPAGARRGKLGYNSTLSKWEWWNGSAWVDLLASPAWADITGKPATFSPATHTHPAYVPTDSGWVSAGFTSLSGWTNVSCRIRKIGSMVHLYVEMNRTGGTIEASSSGHLENVPVVTIPNAYWPDYPVASPIGTTDTDGVGEVSVNGLLALNSMNPNSTIRVNDRLRCSATWMV